MQSPTDCCNGFHKLNQFALVSYLPDPLGAFLDELRLHLVPGCSPHAHVTILPPRPLCGDEEQAKREIRRLADDFSPFDVRLGKVQKFPVSDVIYIEILSGHHQLKAMYRAMNGGASKYCECFPFHPHITLAQNLAKEDVDSTFEKACREWEASGMPRAFRVHTLHFVQNTSVCKWLDLDEIELPIHSLTGH